jgi:hypothetical protein
MTCERGDISMSAQPICPQLYLWRQIYSSLIEAREKTGNMEIPIPPQVFNMQGWMLSTNANKQSRWNLTLAWAAEYGFSHVIPDLSGDDLYDGQS